MDFFEAQEAARRRTSWLIAVFGAAVLAIVAVIYAVLHVAVGPGPGPIDLGLLAYVVLGVGLVIGAGSGIRTASLRRGGPAVAELLGGRRISSDTTDREERVLLNVVEEMSIASGMPVPAIYVLDREDGINAFAAGYSRHDAAVAVTRGALRVLTRDELQGVMAHEFSHILNGDMRLNIRLIGVLYGILLLAVIGRGIVYAGPRGGQRGRGGGAGWVVLVGVALLLVGYIGVFFGKLIKAAVSRQREYLADSAAVQFTRNPDGLAGALKKIGAQTHGSRVDDYHAEELSHLFFANGLGRSLFGFLSTHPPLEERIRRLDPSWSGDFAAPASAPSADHRAAAAGQGFEAVAGLAGSPPSQDSAALVASAGGPTADHLSYAAALLARFPEDLTRAIHEPVHAQALVFALLLANSEGGRETAWEEIRRYRGEELVSRVRALLVQVEQEAADARLPLLDLALPALQNLSPREAGAFRSAVEAVIRADGRLRLFEFVLTHTLSRRLGSATSEADRGGRLIRAFPPLREAVEVVLSAVSLAGAGGDDELAEAAFQAGARRLPPEAGPLRLRPAAELDLGGVDRALTALERAAPAVQRRFLEACAEAAAYDRQLHHSEAELLRAISESLDCPIPPVLPASDPAG